MFLSHPYLYFTEMRDEGWAEFTNLTSLLGVMDLREFGLVFKFFSHLKILELPTVCLMIAY